MRLSGNQIDLEVVIILTGMITMSCPTDVLHREYETFMNHKEELCASSQGKYALISGDDVLGVWETYQDALQAGYEKCGIDKQFLVQRISATDRVHLIYRGTTGSAG